MKTRQFRRCLPLVAALLAGSAMAVDGDPPEIFEFDGDVTDNVVVGDEPPVNGSQIPMVHLGGDDWSLLFDDCGRIPSSTAGDCGTSQAFTGIVQDYDFLGDDSFTDLKFTKGSSKDEQFVGDWEITNSGGQPDKNDITNGYAAAYEVINPSVDPNHCWDADTKAVVPCSDPSSDGPLHEAGDLIFTVGADRYAVQGDATLGAWFFQGDVGVTGADTDNPQFVGEHVIGDLLLIFNFPQSSGSDPEIIIYEWRPDLDPSSPLLLLYDDVAAKCDGLGGKLGCGISNEAIDFGKGQSAGIPIGYQIGPITVPWDYLPKGGVLNGPVPATGFNEGAVNVTKALGEQRCFTSFLLETRSSESIDATLKDFVVGKFPLCNTSLSTEIHDAEAADTYVDIQSTEVAPGDVHDAAYLSFTAPGDLLPSGEVKFELFEATCEDLVADYNNLVDGVPDMSIDDFTAVATHTEDTDNGTLITDGSDVDDLNGDASRVGQLRVQSPNDDTLSPGTAYAYWVNFTSDSDFPDAGPHCEEITAFQLTPTVVTEIHEGTSVGGNHSGTDIQDNPVPNPLTFPWAGAQKVGTLIHDKAFVTGDKGITPDGDIVFRLYGQEGCTGDLLVLDPGDSDGDGSSTTNTVNVTAVNDDDSAAESLTFDTAGLIPMGSNNRVISFKATYTPSTNAYTGASAACENIVIEKYVPKLVTHIHADGDHATDIQDTEQLVGISIHDQAVLTGDAPFNPAGTVTFQLYSDGTCTTANGAAEDVTMTADGGDSGDGKAESSSFDTTSYLVGIVGSNRKLSYTASYGGDSYYVAVDATEPACEVLTIKKRTPTIYTQVKIEDTAVVGGDGSGLSVTSGGNEVTFKIFANGSCSGDPAATETENLTAGLLAVLSQTATIGDNAGERGTTTSVSYLATYNGNQYYDSKTHGCEIVSVTLP
ncbi:hypothetical protein [Oceanimonas baumannii]|uniref:hypothetical protein n=1 Tax=Oceanimonas baumannii TaxID=129578 RepID=UPI003A913299